MDESKIPDLLDKWLAPAKATAAMFERVAALTNPETMIGAQSRLIDLRRKFDIALTENLYLPREQRWEARDMVTFDPDPESRWHIVGRGPTTTEAVSELLADIAEQVAQS